jgi:hypothetical protein
MAGRSRTGALTFEDWRFENLLLLVEQCKWGSRGEISSMVNHQWNAAFGFLAALTIAACGNSSTAGGQGSDVPVATTANQTENAPPMKAPPLGEGTPMGKRAAPVRVRQLTDDEVKTRITPLLGADEQLAHGVFEGPFGPEQGATLVLTSSSKNGPSRLLGWVLLGAEKKRIDLPDLSDSQYIDAVSAVVPVNIDDDSATEIVILSTLISGAGPTAGQPYPHNLVLDWDGSKFVRLAEVEKKIAESTTAEDVNKKIKRP